MVKKGEVHLFYTRVEAAEFLRLSPSTIDVLVARGLLASNKLGRRRVFTQADLADFPKRNLARLWPAKVGGKTTRKGKATKPSLIA